MADLSRFVLCKPHRWHVQEAGKGKTLILLHGAGGATQSWRHLFPLLSKSFHVVAIDLPGQGFTQLGARQRCGLEAMAEDIAKLVTAEGWRPKALVGHSAGAAIALRMAEQMKPAPVVIGINAALAPFEGVSGVLFPILAKALSVMPMVADLFAATNANPNAVKRLIDSTGSRLPREELVFYQALVSDRTHVDATLQMMAQWDLDPLLERLPQHPSDCLLIAGENDKTVRPATSQRAASQMPHARVINLPDLGHLAHEENAPLVAGHIKAFLDPN
ncbi:alpha/beta fold hydrolase BchO [Sulfitobacter aestuariivivens]|nr:alpha/beta fold hydrolase BchO [Sulfitobacter aestuariivivens]